MYNHDWVAHLKLMMDHAQPGDTYDVIHVVPGVKQPCGGSTYVKTEVGYRSALYVNRDLVIEAPYRV